MTYDELLGALVKSDQSSIHIMLPDGAFVPAHFHITEVGRVQKDFIDCGGTIRSIVSCLLQVWVATDVEHRLDASKLAKILTLAGPLLKSGELPIEIEYETSAVSQYPLASVEYTPTGLLLTLGSKHTACLATDRCGVSPLGVVGCAEPGCC